MSLSAPSPPDPTSTADAQAMYNQQAGQQSAELSNINQTNPYGSLTYQRIGTYADGTPKYAATQTLTSAQQGLLNTQQTNQAAAGGAVGSAVGDLGSQLAAGPNLDPSAVTNQLLGWQTNYMAPYFQQQQSNLNSQLENQGIGQGSEAYNNAQKALGNTQGSTVENAMASDEGQAYNQALSSHTAPISTELGALGTIGSYAAPGSVSQNLVNTTPQTVQPANYAGIAEQNYSQANQNYDDTLSGLFGLGSAALGGLARGGGTAGVSGTLGSLGGFLASDRKLKADIEVVGSLFDGTPVYRYRYKHEGVVRIGLMADDVERFAPEAVSEIFGAKAVDYGKATERAVRLAA